MRKVGKSVTADRWEKYLIKMCQDFNSTWAWEMEKKGYLEMSTECKLGILKYLCECQFDDNLKFKNIINEEDADAMRLQPLGRDKDGLTYWYQLDQEHNVRMYVEEQDDQDGSSWKCIVRSRNELAETLELLKAQIDPALLKNQENSSQESPSTEDEEAKKREDTPMQGEPAEGLPQPSEKPPPPAVPAEEKKIKVEKAEERDIIKLPVIVKLEKPPENNGEVPSAKEENDSFKENVKPEKAEAKEHKPEPKDSREANSHAERLALEPERIEFCVSVKTPQDVAERTAEENEKLKNDQQAKIPLKKREIKLTDDFDSLLKAPLRKCITPTKEVSKEEAGKPEEETFKRVPTITDGKFLVNGEMGGEKLPLNNKLDRSPCPKEEAAGLPKEKNGLGEERVQEGVSAIVRTSDAERCFLHPAKETVGVIVPLREEPSPKGGESQPAGRKPDETLSKASDAPKKKFDDSLRANDSVILSNDNLGKPAKLPSPKEPALASEADDLQKTGPSGEKTDSASRDATPSPVSVLSFKKTAVGKEGSDSQVAFPDQRKACEEQEAKTPKDSDPPAGELPAPDSLPNSVKEAPVETKKESVKSKCKYKLISEEDSSLTENREITSERQKDGIKLTIRISSRKKTDPLPNAAAGKEPEEEEVVSVGRILRRSPRISKPTPKVVETRDQKSEKKRSEEEEEKAASLQKQEKKDDSKKPEKETNSKSHKASRRSKVRWAGTRTRGRWRYSCYDDSEGSGNEEDSEEEEEEEEEEEPVPAEDDEPCKKCGLPNHPELILLCDSCDSGYHTACLRPPLMIIPDGEWFCPPCQHKLLCEKLEEQLQDLDVVLKKKERAERRKERLVYVGISIENIIPPREPEIPEPVHEKKKDTKKSKAKLLERRSTRQRKCISYRFDEFDEAIDEAIEDDIKEADGGGVGRGKDMSNITGHRGKDISTILEEERKESKRPPRAAALRRKKRRRLNDLDSDSNLDEEESEDEFRISEGSQDEFVVSDDNPDESEEDQPSNDDSDVEFSKRRPRRYHPRPMRQSRRLQRKTIKKRYSEDDEEEDSEDNLSGNSETDASSEYSDDDYLETRRRSRRNQKRQVNYKEDSESEGSQKSFRYGKEMRRIHKRRLSSSDSEESYLSKHSEDDQPARLSRRSVRKRSHVTDEYSEGEDDPEDEGRPVRKRVNRIETDEEDNGPDADASKPAPAEKPSASPAQPDTAKKPCYRIESEEEDDFDNVGKVESPLDYSLVDLPSTNGQSPGKAIENLIGKPAEKAPLTKDSTANASLAPNGTGGGLEAGGPEEDEDELLRVTDLVDYVCNSEQL
ncbi:remodeling and spacing factor 1 [Protobothrops mucrosquamatus]|uniref:remodeling and spacing factor 1 n=1 Tax=Protobothrops mucrosquamatus TaxID=103944 RepID=UPI000775C41C|nr:remodeling and spacing factor 1 [Protobothrops mucrosquamatus]